jgi:Peroxidase, family 2
MFSHLLSRVLLATLVSSASLACGFGHYASPRRVYGSEIARELPQPASVFPGMTPGPLEFTGTKLVHDAMHPYIAPGEGDQRGPCPGLNVLANHGVCIGHWIAKQWNANNSNSIFLETASPPQLNLSKLYKKVCDSMDVERYRDRLSYHGFQVGTWTTASLD